MWRREQPAGKKKPTKVPYTPTGIKASSIDPGTWATFDQVMAAVGRFDGIGFVFSEHDPYTGCDFDTDADTLEADKLATVQTLASYTERSPSGRGLHVIVKAQLPGQGHKEAGREIYDRGRYFTMTGDILDGAPATIEARQAEIDAYYATFKQAEPVTTRQTAALLWNLRQEWKHCKRAEPHLLWNGTVRERPDWPCASPGLAGAEGCDFPPVWFDARKWDKRPALVRPTAPE